MGISPYAAIVIGSKNMLMKVYEISGGKGFRTVEEIRYEYELGKEAYFTRKITFAQIEEICNVLMEFQQRMREYAITEFRCYATSAIRNAKNQVSVLNQIKIRTGVDVIMLSNSELRFLMYKGIQVLDIDFNKIIEKNTAILDIGSGSVQVSLFDKQALYMTQNLDIGTVKVRGFLESVENNVLDYISVLEEYIQYEFDMFKSGYLKDKDIKNVIAIGDEIKNINRLIPELHLTDTMSYEQILYIYKKIKKASYQDIALKYGLSIEDARMVLPSVLIYKTFLERSKADTVYICATNLCDGSVVDYAQETKKIKLSHDFYQDIVASAKYIGKRYRYSKVHAQYITDLALEIFDKTKKFHGLTQRDRLILEISAILHDIGKVKELSDFPDNDYTDEGQLIGHIVIGVEMIDDAIRSIPDFPVKLAHELKHCIVAHHGELEYGSPKKPALAEAVALNMADSTDAKLQTLTELFKGKTGTEWLGYNRLFESNLRRASED